MFANYRYSTVLRRVNLSSKQNPKDDPILIGDLQGVSGLEEYETKPGWFSKSTEMGFFITSEGEYESKTLIFDGDSWYGDGELVPTPIDRSYSNNGNGTFSEPGRIEGIKNSYLLTNRASGNPEGSITQLYDIHINNINNTLNVGNSEFTINSDFGSKVLAGGRSRLSTNSRAPLYKNTYSHVLGQTTALIYIELLASTNADRTDFILNALGTKNVSFTGNTTSEVAILARTNTSESGSISDLSYNSSVTKRSLSDYSTLAYNQIINKADQGKKDSWSGDFRIKLGKDPRITRKSIDVYGKKIDAGYKDTATKISTINPNGEKDFIPFSISSYAYSGSVSFTAFLTSFNDNISPSWEDVKYVGRQDTLKHFVGVTRTAGVGFKVAAFNRDDIDKIYGKLKNLIKYAGVGGVDKSTVLTAPVVKLTLGSWFSGTPCVVTSIKYDVQLADYAWDIDKNIPQLVDVSLDFFILGDKTGKALNSATNNYLY